MGSVGFSMNFIEQSCAIFFAKEDFPIPKGAAITAVGLLSFKKESISHTRFFSISCSSESQVFLLTIYVLFST
jgi:hypothetical protein